MSVLKKTGPNSTLKMKNINKFTEKLQREKIVNFSVLIGLTLTYLLKPKGCNNSNFYG